MLLTTIELKEPLTYISRLTKNNEYKAIFFTDREWGFLTHLKEIFEVFNKPSIRLQSELYISLNKGLLYIYTIFEKLGELASNYAIKATLTPNSVSIL